IARLLEASRIRIAATRLEALPDRYPGSFLIGPAGGLVAVQGKAHEADREGDGTEEHLREPAWRSAGEPKRLDLDQVVVLDIETTGLDSERDEIWEIAAVNLGTGELFQQRTAVSPQFEGLVPSTDEARESVSLAIALEQL